MILDVYFAPVFNIDIWFETGVKNKVRCIPLHKIAEKLHPEQTRLLLAFLALTSCDSTSCFKGTGKKKAFELLKYRQNTLAALSEIGKSFAPSKEALESSEEFVCRFYQLKSDKTEINALRHKMIVKNPRPGQKLPRCKDSLLQHLACCNYQCTIRKSSVLAKPGLLSPENNGWTITKEGLVPTFGIQNAAPKELLELSSCGCKK